MMIERLNEIQQKRVEEYYYLIISYLKTYCLDEDSIEDWYGAAAVGLCRAALCYDPSGGEGFPEFAYRYIEAEIKEERRRSSDCIYGVNLELIADEDDPYDAINNAV